MEVASILALAAEEKGLELHCDVDARLAMPLVGDPARLRQVLVNLVNNAIKFTRVGEVTLRAAAVNEDGTRVRFEVQDTGIGIAPEAQSRLFTPFTQLDATATREHGGTGLGLAICRELVTRMGGSIGVTSMPGAGSTFWFEVSLARGGRLSAPENLAALRGKRVLVVDDNATNRELVRTLLTQTGMLCDLAEDGPRALELLDEAVHTHPYVLLLVDHRMPGMDGRELVRRLRADPRFEAVRIVMIGSVARTLDAAEQRALRIVGYATKPIWRRQLLGVVSAALNGSPADAVHARAAETAAIAPHGRVLLVEDSAISAEVAGEILTKGGYTFDLVGDGAAAVEAVRSRAYDVVLMDCQLPVLDGFEATRLIRAIEREGKHTGNRSAPLPIIALTASATTGDLARCKEAGMNDYVPKPVDARRLLATVASHIGNGRSEEPPLSVGFGEPSFVADLPRALARLGGHEELLHRIMAPFVEAAARARAELLEAAEKRDHAAVAFYAHRLRGQAASFEASALVMASMALEDAARHGSEDVTEALDRALRELERLVEFLRQRVP
jgi:CheY-like chemotaxis protein/HPt (histidine-containing phosphotransfer) domain-containing protein